MLAATGEDPRSRMKTSAKSSAHLPPTGRQNVLREPIRVGWSNAGPVGPRGFDLRRALRSSKPAISPRALRLLRKKYACRAASRLLRSDHCLGSSWVLRHHTSCTNLHAAVGVGVRVRRRYPCVLRTTTSTNIFCTRTGQLQINESKCSLTFVKH